MNNGDTHTYQLAEFDAVCFCCILRRCNDTDPLCLHHMLVRLRAAEKRAGGDWARVVEMLSSRKGRT
jgi:hypothetical protein